MIIELLRNGQPFKIDIDNGTTTDEHGNVTQVPELKEQPLPSAPQPDLQAQIDNLTQVVNAITSIPAVADSLPADVQAQVDQLTP